MIFLITLAVIWLAYANGANDNFKGVATLVGSGTTDYRPARRFATILTLAGSFASIAVGSRLVQVFSGQGLLPDAVVGDSTFLTAVALSTAITVFLATRLGLPVSTTHALVGALIGSGAALFGLYQLNFSVLGKVFVTPLLLGPILALVIAVVIYSMLHRTRLALGISRETCLCIGEKVHVVLIEPSHAVKSAQAVAVRTDLLPSLAVGSETECFERYAGKLIGVNIQMLLDRLHWLSAGAVCFARGLNDTPKIVALLVAVKASNRPFAIALIGLAMAVGGLISARRVAETMSHRITAMNHGQGLAANLVTSALVIAASGWGLPVSTTHVSCGSLFGIGLANRQAKWKTVGSIALAWIITLPTAALTAFTIMRLSRFFS